MKNYQELITIIVPVFNAEKSLVQCIDSILEQSYSKFELLLINDGSTDKSGQLCDDYMLKDDRVRVFHQNNRGVSSARNVGLDNANGVYVFFIDSDDRVNKDYIHNFLTDNLINYDNILIVQEIYRENTKGINKLYTLNNLVFEANQYNILFSKYNLYEYGYAAAKLYKNEIIQRENIRFHTKVSYTEDLLFMLEYIKHTDNIILSTICNYYYIENNNPSLSLSMKYNSFESELFTFEIFKSVTINLISKFNLKGKSLNNTKRQLGIRLFRVIYSLYRPQFKKKYPERIILLKQIVTKENKIYLNHVNRKDKMIINKFTLLFFNLNSINLIDKVFLFLFRIRFIMEEINRNIKYQIRF